MVDIRPKKKQKKNNEPKTNLMNDDVKALGLEIANTLSENNQIKINQKFDTIMDTEMDMSEYPYILRKKDMIKNILNKETKDITTKTKGFINKALQKINNMYDLYNDEIDIIFEEFIITRTRVIKNKINQLNEQMESNNKIIDDLTAKNVILENYRKDLMDTFNNI